MVDPKRRDSREEGDEKESKPRVKRETVKDLDPKSDRSEDVKGGGTLKQPDDGNQCWEAETM